MINFDNFLKTLPIMGKGVLGIFIVIIVIVFAVFILELLFPPKKKDESNKK